MEYDFSESQAPSSSCLLPAPAGTCDCRSLLTSDSKSEKSGLSICSRERAFHTKGRGSAALKPSATSAIQQQSVYKSSGHLLLPHQQGGDPAESSWTLVLVKPRPPLTLQGSDFFFLFKYLFDSLQLINSTSFWRKGGRDYSSSIHR